MSVDNIDKVPPDKLTNLPQISHKSSNPKISNIGNDPSSYQRNIDDYREPDSEDEYDGDTQSLVDGIDPREKMGTSYQVQTGPLLHTSDVNEIRDVAGKQGLSPRGRKLLKQSKTNILSRPNTRARSRGF